MARYPRASDNVSTLSDRVYSALVEKARGLSHVVHPLHVGDTYLAPMAGARAEDQLSANSPRLHNYAPVQGEPVLLDAIVSRLQRSHGVHVDREALQVMSGATGGLSVVATTLFDPGDDVLVLSPFWPLIRGIVASRGARAVELPFYDRLGAAGFDPEAALEAALTERTVALYVNSPNNPSGRILDAATQDVIETSRTNMSVQQRTHAAVLALLAAEGLDPLFHLVTEELPLVLGVDAMTIGFEPAFPPMTRLIAPDVHSLTPGTVDRLLGEGGDISLRKDMADDGTVFGPAADLVRSAALVRIQPGGEAPVGLFAIGAREPDVFQPRQGTELVAFLARVVERCVERWLATPE